MKKYILVVFTVAVILVSLFLQKEPELQQDNIEPSKIKEPIPRVVTETKKKQVAKKTGSVELSDKENSESPSNKLYGDGIPLPSDEILEREIKLNEKRKLLISNQFTNNEEWASVFMTDEYSEWGLGMTTKLQNLVYNNDSWEKRPANLESVECKTRFCKISFSFDENTPLKNRNLIYLDFFPTDEPSLSFASFYDAELQVQNIYAERCIDCEKKLESND